MCLLSSKKAGRLDLCDVKIHLCCVPSVELMTSAFACRAAAISSLALLLANCASENAGRTRPMSAQNQREIGAFSDSNKYGRASPRVVADGSSVPKGGGRDHVGKPYQVAGRWYTPRENPGYTVTGHASWYGDAFHGRKTANGEIYDKHAYSAAHPTMPLPSYARVTNLKNGHSVVVRVNDRGPFHGGRVIDLSERVAYSLDFKSSGTARVKVDYLRRANTRGSDDRILSASLRTDGQMAQLPGEPTPAPTGEPRVMLASAQESVPLSASVPVTRAAAPVRAPVTAPAVASVASAPLRSDLPAETLALQEIRPVRRDIPMPLDRPMDLGTIPGAGTPIGRVNNGQETRPSGTQRVASAVFFAPTQGFDAAFAGKDPMRKLKPGKFERMEHAPARTTAAR
jgi:rare lipoprotein A